MNRRSVSGKRGEVVLDGEPTVVKLAKEIRCYMRDPDGHLIEVGQTTGVPS